jgi:Concanavalin A-like lectin/glucanases superfamily
VNDGTNKIKVEDLQRVFGQNFAKLSDPFNETAGLNINQSNIHIEIIKNFLFKVKSLVAHWKLDEGSGTSTGDSSNNGNGGVITNAAWNNQGKYGSALSFQKNSSVTIQHSPTLEIGKSGADFSVLFWIRLKEGRITGRNWTHVLQKGNKDQERTPGIWINSENQMLYTVSVSESPATSIGRLSNKVLEANKWIHIGYIKEGKNLKLFIDGVLDSQLVLQGVDSVSFPTPLRLGKGQTEFNYDSFIGDLDDVRIYQKALPQPLIEFIMNNQDYINKLDDAYDRYLQESYESMLANIGTSLDEVRELNGIKTEKKITS